MASLASLKLIAVLAPVCWAMRAAKATSLVSAGFWFDPVRGVGVDSRLISKRGSGAAAIASVPDLSFCGTAAMRLLAFASVDGAIGLFTLGTAAETACCDGPKASCAGNWDESWGGSWKDCDGSWLGAMSALCASVDAGAGVSCGRISPKIALNCAGRGSPAGFGDG